MWLGTMLLLLGTVGVLVTSRIALAVLLATGPVFVVMALFGPTRGLTAGWLRALMLTAITPLFVTLGGSLMLELLVPVVAGLRGAEGTIDVRAAMALFLLACVHCALMVMMLKVAGTMAAAWNAFGLASSEAERQARLRPLPPPTAPAQWQRPKRRSVIASRAPATVMRASVEPAMVASAPSAGRLARAGAVTAGGQPSFHHFACPCRHLAAARCARAASAAASLRPVILFPAR